MAQITLGSNESFTVSGGTNTISGTTGGAETVTINGGVNVFTADFNAGGDRVILAGSASQYTVERSGSSIVLRGPNGTTVTFPAPNPNLADSANPRISFTNSGAQQDFVLDSTTAGVFTLTPTAAGSTSQTINTTPATVASSGGGQPTPGTTLNVTATDVTEGQNITYTFTLSAAQTTAVTFNVVTTGGTATAGSDYNPVSTTITFAPGQTTQFLTVTTIDDTQPEQAETVTIQVSGLPSGVTLAAGADLTAVIAASDGAVPGQFILTTGNDTLNGGDANDRFVGAQDNTLPGKLLSVNDVVDGGAGVDSIELTNAVGGGAANVLADIDFTNVTNVETLITNYANVQLGAQADKAGIVTVDTASRIDAANVAGTVFGGTLLDLTSDANGDGVADFNNVLNVTMANSVQDTVRLSLASAAGSSFNTGTSFTPIGGAATIGVIDNVVFNANTNAANPALLNQIRVSFVSSQAGNGNAISSIDNTNLAVDVQSDDGTGNGVTGGIVRFDDEGLNLTGAAGQVFNVRGLANAATGDAASDRGLFAQVILGTQLGETLNGGVTVLSGGVVRGAYINAGAGNDIVNGTTAADFLVGGAGNDTLNGGAGVDSLLGGEGNDVINGGAGIDAMLNGGNGSDVYVFADGEFVANEAITDTGTGANDIDYLSITSSTPLTDAQFAGRTGLEGLATNVTNGGGFEVTLDANAQATGIRTVFLGDDDLNAAGYTANLTVYGSGTIITGAGADTVALQNQIVQNGINTANSSAAVQSYAGSIDLDGGNDTLYAGYALANFAGNSIAAGAGNDTLVLGGSTAGQGGVLNNANLTFALGTPTVTNGFGYTTGQAYAPIGAGITGFETINIVTSANSAVSYTLSFVNSNVEAGTTLTVNGSQLRTGVTVAGADGVTGTGDDVTGLNEVLIVDASALTGTRAVNVTGGAASDTLTGGAGADTLNGGAGNDTLTGNAGNDILNGGAGDDVLNGGAGTDTMNGGEGSDDYRFADTEFVAGDIIADDGTAGSDSVSITSATALTDALFAGKTGIEVLNSNVTTAAAGAEVTIGANAQAAGIRTVNNGNDDVDASAYTVGVTVNTGYQVINSVRSLNADAGSVTTGSGNDVVNLVTSVSTNLLAAGSVFSLGAGNDVFNAGYELSFNNAAATVNLNGGTGIDGVTVNGTRRRGFDGTATTAFSPGVGGLVETRTYNFGANANFVGFEQITVLGGDAAESVTGAGNDIAGNATSATITLADQNIAAGTTFFVDASSLIAVTTGLGADGEIGGTGANADTVNTPILTLNAAGVTRNLDVRGGSGNDVINTGSGNDAINGGAGNDTINAGAGADTIDGGDGNDIITGGDGFDTIRGGAGNDTIILSVTQFNSDADTVDGGAGNDILQITGPAGPQAIADVGFNGRFTSIEEVRLVGTAPGTQFNYQAGFYSQTAGVNLISLGANASGSTVSIANYTQGGPGNFPAPTVTLNDILVTTNDTTFVGSAFADTFNLGVVNTALGGGTDVVRAGAGDDVINFGSTLTTADLANGEAGNDTLNVSGNGTTQTVTLSVTAVGGTTPTSGIYSIETINLLSGISSVAGTPAAGGLPGTATSYTVTVDDTSFDSATSTLTVNGGGLRTVSTGVGADGIFGTADDVTLTEVLTYDGSAVTGTRIQVVTGGAGNDTITGGQGTDTLIGGAGNDTLDGNGGADTLDGGAGDDTITGGGGNDTITGGTGSDTINGGGGADTINLGLDGARDTVNVGANGAPRADAVGIEQINGFETGTRGAGADGVVGNGTNAASADDTYTATADVIDFGFGIINENSSSITNGVVQQGSILQNAINSSSSLLAAIQLVEQEFNADAVLNQGVVSFTYGGNTYIGVIQDTDPTAGITEAFTSIVQINGLSGVTGLIDDAAVPGTALGLYI